MSHAEMEIVSLTTGEWREIQSAAAELDLIHGGLFRSRATSIHFYAGPENKPEVWTDGFPDGSPDLPRAMVGTAEVYGRDGENAVSVRLSVTNWPAARALKAAYDRGEYRGRFEEFILAQEAALRGRPEDRAWLRRQFERLRAHAVGKLIGNR